MTSKGMGWSLGVVIGFLTFVGVGASVTHYLQEPYNPGFLRFPTRRCTWSWAASIWPSCRSSS
jgi:hypothetical protein